MDPSETPASGISPDTFSLLLPNDDKLLITPGRERTIIEPLVGTTLRRLNTVALDAYAYDIEPLKREFENVPPGADPRDTFSYLYELLTRKDPFRALADTAAQLWRISKDRPWERRVIWSRGVSDHYQRMSHIWAPLDPEGRLEQSLPGPRTLDLRDLANRQTLDNSLLYNLYYDHRNDSWVEMTFWEPDGCLLLLRMWHRLPSAEKRILQRSTLSRLAPSVHRAIRRLLSPPESGLIDVRKARGNAASNHDARVHRRSEPSVFIYQAPLNEEQERQPPKAEHLPSPESKPKNISTDSPRPPSAKTVDAPDVQELLCQRRELIKQLVALDAKILDQIGFAESIEADFFRLGNPALKLLRDGRARAVTVDRKEKQCILHPPCPGSDLDKQASDSIPVRRLHVASGQVLEEVFEGSILRVRAGRGRHPRQVALLLPPSQESALSAHITQISRLLKQIP